MKCKENGCKGRIDKSRQITLFGKCRNGELLPAIVFPCGDCFRLHSDSGGTFFDGAGRKAYLNPVTMLPVYRKK